MVFRKAFVGILAALLLLPAVGWGQLQGSQWSITGEAGSFAPAGWSHDEVPALTRVQAVRMQLVVNIFLDERFDPVKGKNAVMKFYARNVEVISNDVMVIDAGAVLLEDLAKASDMPLRLIEKQNPHLLRDILPKGSSIYGLKCELSEVEALALVEHQNTYTSDLKVQYEKRRTQVLSLMPDPETSKATTYVVRNGDYLGLIAIRTGTKVTDIRKWNKLKGNTIYPGQQLTVWIPKSTESNDEKDVQESTKPKPTENTVKPKVAESSYLTYVVKPGDSLWSIAQKFPGVSADNLKSYNKMDVLIKVGEQLKIPTQMISDYSPEKYPEAQ